MRHITRHLHFQQWAAIILLLIMIVQVGVKVTHIDYHSENAIVICDDCIHHHAHNGHIQNLDDGCSECVICQLLSVPFNIAESLQICSSSEFLPISHCVIIANAQRLQQHAIQLRAPPTVPLFS